MEQVTRNFARIRNAKKRHSALEVAKLMDAMLDAKSEAHAKDALIQMTERDHIEREKEKDRLHKRILELENLLNEANLHQEVLRTQVLRCLSSLARLHFVLQIEDAKNETNVLSNLAKKQATKIKDYQGRISELDSQCIQLSKTVNERQHENTNITAKCFDSSSELSACIRRVFPQTTDGTGVSSVCSVQSFWLSSEELRSRESDIATASRAPEAASASRDG